MILNRKQQERLDAITQKPYTLPDGFELPKQSEIVPGLFQGFRPESYVGFDLVVSCEQHLAKKPMQGYSGVTVHLPMRDEDDFEIPRAVVEVGILAAEFVFDGKRVLVHCSGGLNRSSLVTAWAVVNIVGCNPKEAVAIIRRQHDAYCLCNRAFERWVTGEKLPTAETSAFRPQVQRRCDGCRGPLTGKRAHGWVSVDGKAIQCSPCEFPRRKQRWKRKR